MNAAAKSTHKKERSLQQRWLPHPLLTLLLIMLWIALQNDFSNGTLVMAVLLGMLIPSFTANFWPDRPMIRSPFQAISFLGILIWDIILANIEVAKLIVFHKAEELNSGWICVPLELRNAEAITVLAATISLTPGTVSSDLSTDGKSLLVHCLDLKDADAVIARIKNRYEKRLREIFP